MVSEDLGSFIKENKRLLREYIDLKMEYYKLKLTRMVSIVAGNAIWILVLLFLAFLFFTFVGLFTGFWLSSITGSYVSGFGLTAAAILVFILLIAIFRKPLFINPVIKIMIRLTTGDAGEERKQEYSKN